MVAPIFDSNIVIDWLVNREPAILELERHSAHSISRITWMEVLAGEPLETRAEIRERLNFFDILEVDARVATVAIDVRYRLKIKLLDAIIFATAQSSGAILITRDTKAFSANMPGVRIPYTLQ